MQFLWILKWFDEIDTPRIVQYTLDKQVDILMLWHIIKFRYASPNNIHPHNLSLIEMLLDKKCYSQRMYRWGKFDIDIRFVFVFFCW